MKLRTKFLLLLTPLLVTPLLAIGTLGYRELRRTSQENIFAQMHHLTDELGDAVSTLVRTASANTALFSHHLIVEQYVLASSPEARYALLQRPLLRTFRAFQQVYPEYYELRIILPDGVEDARWTRDELPNATEDESEQPLFQLLAASGRESSVVLRNPDTGTIALQVAAPLLLTDAGAAASAAPTLRGYLAVTVDLTQLDEALGAAKIMDEHRSFATDAQGMILLHPDRHEVGRHLPASLFEQLRAGVADDRLLLIELDGIPCYVRGAQPRADMFLFTALPQSKLLESSNRLRAVVTPIILVTILVTLGLLFFALNRLVVGPVNALGRAAQQIGQGDLKVTIAPASRDEIGELATAFSEMSHNLGASHEQIRMLAYHDGLTGLPNRRLFNELLEQALARARRDNEGLAVLFVDFDNFKRINDSIGHDAADAVLRGMAETLSRIIRTDDVLSLHARGDVQAVVSRVGGDEFVMLLPHTRDRFSPGIVARRILDHLNRPIRAGEQEVIVTASIGVATYPEDGTSGATLIRNADTAMYHAKEQGKAGYQYYSEAMNVASVERLSLESGLRRALEEARLELHYQPQVDLKSGRIVGAETLLRWNHPQRGYISPASFIPIAEETGLILPIGEWVLERACQQAVEWQRGGLPGIPVSVNVSGAQFSRQDLCSIVTRALESSGLQPALLGIEITETAMMAVPDRAVELLQQLRALGVRLSLDDFGTGYSSLSYLKSFPISTLKIDRSFVCEILTDQHTASITEAIISMAHVLGLHVVAEGVEEQLQIDLLRSWDCDAVQGYYYSPAVPAQRFGELLASTHGGALLPAAGSTASLRSRSA